MSPEQMKIFVTEHFESLINRGDLSTIERNVRADYIDHNGPGGGRTGLDQSRARTARSLTKMQNLKVEVRDVLADGDKVVVRNVWTAFDEERAERIEMHGFVQFRIQDGQLAERWATITEPAVLNGDTFDW